VARETARDAPHPARQMARGEIKAASVAWSTLDELTPAMRARAIRDRHTELAADRQTEAPSRHKVEASQGQSLATRSPTAASPPRPGKEERAAPEILIPGSGWIPAALPLSQRRTATCDGGGRRSFTT
jgi:hypothetical protein